MPYIKAALALWSNRSRLLPLLAVAAAIPALLITVLTSAAASVPAFPDNLLPLYAEAARKAPVNISYEDLVAVDAIRFRQDFSRVTPESIRQTAAMFYLCTRETNPDTGEVDITCDERALTEVMRDLRFDSEDRQMVLSMLAGLKEGADGGSGGEGGGGGTFDPGGAYTWPATCPTLTDRFGMRIHPIRKTVDFHTGVDIACVEGSDIRAAATGTVIFADWDGGYGQIVRVNHGGFITAYGHLSRISVRVGQIIPAGELIGLEGTTGNSTGPHLHFEWWVEGKPLDPLSYY